MHDVFICYSRAADTDLAVALRYGLHAFNRRLTKPRALRVFRDDSSLTANPAHWPSIAANLDDSRYLILLASAQAADSPWVERELMYWREHKDPQRILLVLTDPEPSPDESPDIRWDNQRNDFDWSVTTALPKCLSGAFTDEPRWVRLTRTIQPLSLRDPVFKNAVADLAGPLHGKPKDQLIGEDISKHRLRRRLTTLAVTAILIATAVAIQQAFVARDAQHEAENQLRAAVASRLVVQADALRDDDPRAALQLGLAAHRIQPGPATTASLVHTLTTAPGFRLGDPLEHTGALHTVAFSPVGHTLATGGSDKRITMWDVADRSHPRRVGAVADVGADVNSVAYSQDGHTLAGAIGQSVQLWDVTDPTRPQRLGQPLATTAVVRSISIARDRPLLAAGGLDGTITLWDLTDPAHPRRLGQPLGGHAWPVNSVALSQDGHTLATGSDDHTVILWDVTNTDRPQRLGEPLTEPAPVQSVMISGDGRTLASSSDAPDSNPSVITLRDISDRTHPKQLGEPILEADDSARAVAFNPAALRLAASGGNNAVSQWDITDRTRPRWLGPRLTGHSNVVPAIAFSSDGRTLATASYDGTVLLWDVADDLNKPRRLDLPPDAADRVAFSADRRTLATTSTGNTVSLWDMRDRTRPRQLGKPLGDGAVQIGSIALSHNGRTLAVSNAYPSGEVKVTLWDISTPGQPRSITQIPVSFLDVVGPVAFSPDGRLLAVAVFYTVTFWDVNQPAQPRQRGDITRQGQYGPISSLVFSKDGSTLAASAYGTVDLLDVGDGTQPRLWGKPITGHTDRVSGVAFSPDGNILASTSDDTTTILWDVTDRTHPRRLGQPLTGHDNRVWAVAFTDKYIMATGSYDNSVILWYMADPEHPVQLTRLLVGAANPPRSVAFSPDGRTLAAGTHKAPVLWDLDSLRELIDNPTQRACELSGGLDETTWKFYVPELPYQNPC